MAAKTKPATEPAAIKALRASLAGATESPLRERLEVAIQGLKRLYGISDGPPDQDNGDMRRRHFVADRHPAPKRIYSPKLAPTDDSDLL